MLEVQFAVVILPAGYYVLLALIAFVLNGVLSKAISGSSGPIFTNFIPRGRYLIVDYLPDPFLRSFKVRCHGNQF